MNGQLSNRGELDGPFPYQLMYFGKHINLNLLRVFVFVIQFPEISSFTMKAFLHFVPQTEIESDDLIFLIFPPAERQEQGGPPKDHIIVEQIPHPTFYPDNFLKSQLVLLKIRRAA